jgi:uncharacterized protein (TIGR00730 family)
MSDEPIINSPAGEALPSPHETRMSSDISRDERHHAMGSMLSGAIEEGKRSVPELPDPLMFKPNQIESWRIFKIMSEFVEGFDLLRKYTKAATFFGSARESFDPTLYQAATDLAGRLAKAGFAIITGGSSGIMKAANKGAYDAGGASVGLNIRLEDNQSINKYVTDGMTFDHFFVRKVMLTFASEVYIYFPGGYGTFDEFFEILTLVQTKKIRRVPIVLFDSEYWKPLLALFKDKLLDEYGAISESDLEFYHLVDTVDEAFDYIVKSVATK